MERVMVILGSKSDIELVRPCMETLAELQIDYKATVCSAHRTPGRLEEIMKDAGPDVYICAAGMAAHLAGAVAARTIRPVIGLPLAGAVLAGMDALFSTVQMPSGFPVATVALNGARNAALLAAQILALRDAELGKRLLQMRQTMAAAVIDAGRELEKRLNQD